MNSQNRVINFWNKLLVGALFVITFSTNIQSQADAFSYGGSFGNPFEQSASLSVVASVQPLNIQQTAQVVGNADVLLTRFGIDLSKFKTGWFGGWTDFDAVSIQRDAEGNSVAVDAKAEEKRLEKLKIDRLKELWDEYMQAFKNDLQAASNALMDDIKALDKRRAETKNKDLQKKYVYFVELALQVKNQMDAALMNVQVEKIMTEISPLSGVMLAEGFKQVEFNLNLAQKVRNENLFNIYQKVRMLLSIIDNEIAEIKKDVNGSLEKSLKKAEEDLKNTERAKNMTFKSTQYDNHILLYRQVVAQLKLEIAAAKKQTAEKMARDVKIKNDAQKWFNETLKPMDVEKSFALVQARFDEATKKNDLFMVDVCTLTFDLLENLRLERQVEADNARVEEQKALEKVNNKVDEMVAKYGSLKVARERSQESLKKSTDAKQREFIVQVINAIKEREAADPFNKSINAIKNIRSVGDAPAVLADAVTSTLSVLGINRSKLSDEQNEQIDALIVEYAQRLQEKALDPSKNPAETETTILKDFTVKLTSVVTGIDSSIIASQDMKRIGIAGATNALVSWLTPKKKEATDF